MKTFCAPSRRKPSASLLLALLTGIGSVLAPGLVPGSVSAETVNWGGSDGDWRTGSNWSTGSVPASTDTINIDAGTTTLTFPDPTENLTLSGNAALNVTGSGTARILGTIFLNGNSTLTLSSENATLQTVTTDGSVKGGTLNVAGSTGGTATVTIQAGTLDHNGYDIHVGMGGVGVVNQTGGTVTLTAGNQWLNIGERSTGSGTWNISGGQLEAGMLVVGRRGEGHMTIDGTAAVTASKLILGYFSQRAPNSVLTLAGGTLTSNGNAYFGGYANEAAPANSSTNYTFNMTGGTLETKSETYFGNYDKDHNGTNNLALASTANIQGGTWNASKLVTIGNVVTGGTWSNVAITNTTNSLSAILNLSGGTINFNDEVKVGNMSIASGINASGKLNVSGSAIVNFNKPLLVGASANSVAKVTVSGGTSTFNDVVKIGDASGTSALFEVTGGENLTFTKQVLIGSAANGTMTLSGGKTTFALTGTTMILGNASGATGTLNVTGSAVATVTGYDVHLGANGGKGVLNQSGGTLTLGCWLNVGEGGVGEANLSGGALVTNGPVAVGRRQVGTMNVTGTGKLQAKNGLYVGMFATKTGDSLLHVNGGTVEANTLFVGNQSSNEENNWGTRTGVSTLTVDAGNLTVSGESTIAYGGLDKKGAVAVMNLNDGTSSFATLYVGRGVSDAALADGTLNVTGGTHTVAQLKVGNEANSKGTLKVSGGELKVGSMIVSNHATQGNVEISGGALRMTATDSTRSFIGYGDGSVGTLTIRGGTLYGCGADFCVGGSGTAFGTMTVNGGTFNQHGTGNFVILPGSGNGTTGNVLNLSSGTIDSLWFSLSQELIGSPDTAVSTFNMTGGTVKAGNHMRLGLNRKGNANISGGTLQITGEIQLDASGKGSVLSITGPDSVWNVGGLNFYGTGLVNLTAGSFTPNRDGTPKAALPTINVSGTANVSSAVSIDMTNYVCESAALFDSTTQTILKAGTLNWSPASVTVSDGWKLTTTGTTADLALDESKIAFVDLNGTGTAYGKLGESGWMKISGTAGEDYSLKILYGGTEKGDELAVWLDSALGSSASVANTGEFLKISGTLGADGVDWLYWNLDDFNLQNQTSATFSNLPEPSSIVLMILGILGFIGFNRKKF